MSKMDADEVTNEVVFICGFLSMSKDSRSDESRLQLSWVRWLRRRRRTAWKHDDQGLTGRSRQTLHIAFALSVSVASLCDAGQWQSMQRRSAALHCGLESPLERCSTTAFILHVSRS